MNTKQFLQTNRMPNILFGITALCIIGVFVSLVLIKISNPPTEKVTKETTYLSDDGGYECLKRHYVNLEDPTKTRNMINLFPGRFNRLSQDSESMIICRDDNGDNIYESMWFWGWPNSGTSSELVFTGGNPKDWKNWKNTDNPRLTMLSEKETQHFVTLIEKLL